jgi:hypothetical protein
MKNRLCPHCNSDLHACKNCIHYDENLSSKCKEPESPWIGDRSAQNSCTYFEFVTITTGESPLSDRHAEAEEAKKAFKALFRNL